ncbi:MAG: response regulator [Gammaproteobacteria bacterium]|nr:response regulator [Gammaproteobacteria bacterium]
MSTASVMVVEDDNELREALSETLSLAGYKVATASDGQEALGQLDDMAFDLIVSDIQMPHMDGHSLLKKVKSLHPELPVMLMTAYGSIQQAVDAMRDGAVDYMVKPFEAEVLVNMVSRYASQANNEITNAIAADAQSRQLFQIAKRVAQSDATVMITGESGVGKEVLARYVHQHSARAEQPFVAINCAAIPENMLEATLFGYEKGAYTGAYKACPGKFEQAQGGTLLLDEITEMDLGLQAKLLRVLQEREVERLGGTKTIALDVRVIATSNREVRSYVAAGKFREDLFYRLNVFPLHILPLRLRPADIIPLAEQKLQRLCSQQNRRVPQLDAGAQAKLQGHGWTGNVRELDNVMQRALILQQGEMITEDDIHFEISEQAAVSAISQTPAPAMPSMQAAANSAGADSLNDDLKQREWSVILKAIATANGSRKKAAERLGISQRTLRYKLARMREAGISIPGKTSAEAF